MQDLGVGGIEQADRDIATATARFTVTAGDGSTEEVEREYARKTAELGETLMHELEKGIMLRQLDTLGLVVKTLQTRQSSLEDIFVDLVHAQQ